MRRLLASIVGLCLIATSALAFYQSRDSNYNQSIVASGGGCTASTNFLARTSGMSGGETTAFQTLICGLVTDGVITGNLSGATGCGTKLDALYVFATNTTTSALLNLCGTSFSLTSSGSCSFTADQGYTGDGSTCFLNSGFNPNTAAGNASLNSMHLSSCVLTSDTTGGTGVTIGGQGASSFAYMQPLNGGNFASELNGGSFPTTANANAQGSWITDRAGSSGYNVYKNGSSIATLTSTSTSLMAANVYVLAYNNNGSTANFYNNKVAYASIGGSLGATLAAALYNRMHTFLAALGNSAC